MTGPHGARVIMEFVAWAFVLSCVVVVGACAFIAFGAALDAWNASRRGSDEG